MMDDGQSYFGSTIGGEQIHAQVTSRAAVLPFNSSLQAYVDGACNVVRLPLHVGGRLAELPRQIVYVDRANETRRHEFCRAQHSHDGLSTYSRTLAFDPSHGVGWQEVLSWYLIGLTRFLDISMVGIIVQPGLWSAKGVRGLDHYWDLGRTPQHSMDWLSHGINSMVDLVIDHWTHPHFHIPTRVLDNNSDRSS